jgi:Flp pilus assembly protein TadB
MIFRRERTDVVLSVLVVLMVAGLLFASSAWSLDRSSSSSQQDRTDTSKKRRNQNSSAQAAKTPGASLNEKNPSARAAFQAVDQVEASQTDGSMGREPRKLTLLTTPR